MRAPTLSRSAPLLLTLAAISAACGDATPPPRVASPLPPASASAQPAAVAPATTARGVDGAAMDRAVAPGEDFYGFANGGWLRATEIPADRPSTGAFVRIDEAVMLRTRAFLDAAAAGNAAAGSPERRMGDYYASVLDEAAIEARGVAPLKPVFDRLARITDKKALARELGSQLRVDVDPLNHTHFHTSNVFGLWVEQDLNNPARATAYVLQGGLGMPDRSYYVDDAARMQEVRAKYKAYITTLLKLAGIAKPEDKAARVLELEKKLAAVHASRADSSDVAKCNHPWKREDFAVKAPGLDWDAYFRAASLEQQDFIAWQPQAIAGISALLASELLATWKDYLVVRALDRAAPLLPKAFVDAHFALYGTALRGTPQPRDRWKRAIDATNEALGDTVGKAYVERHFRPEHKAEVKSMVEAIAAAFGQRIDAIAWMSAETRAKAKAKLATLRVGIAYPDTWRDDAGFEVVRGDPLGNRERAGLFHAKRELAKLGKPVDRNEWAMNAHEVNALNLPVRNALNFPAAILEPPFFVAEATPAVKFGAIGAVIGHEISHSFDDQGAQFDAEGRFVNWWLPTDLQRFEQSGAALAAQYDRYRPFPDAPVNGKLTLSENIADLAGLAASYDAWKASLGGAPAPVTADGLTGEQQFFISFAQSWQSKMREPALRQRLTTDGHAPGMYRALTVRNLDAWYGAFEVKPSDALFLAPEARVRVW
jgi:putative endopeptidase